MSRAFELVREVEDKSAFLALMMRHWGSHRMMIGLRTYDCAEIPLLGLFSAAGEPLALASWASEGDTAVLCALHALKPGEGAAERLLEAVKTAAKARGAVRLRAMLTNDNMPGLAFYQKHGFRFSGLYLEAIDAYRSVIPTIIRTGHEGIPVRDALELEIAL
ncbi:GNAT family N-acetyltransferase [Bosea sp. (in: a-proteobacteria)]|uniref:GNAT family N-acetyltransferase n=1 Tax=Bosea sp. (in: a-proteobacteria) TaxID=1871050 RepID=UPI002FCC985E